MSSRSPALLGALLLAQAASAQVTTRDGVFAEPERATASADVAVDVAGGLHRAWVRREPDAEGAEAAYGFCGAGMPGCGDPAAWTVVPLSGAAHEVEVALTPDGRPRLLITVTSTAQPGGLDRQYAECDAGCDAPEGWRTVTVATSWDNGMSTFLADRLPQRTFVIDPAGRPMFLYSDRNYLIEPDHYGTFWMTCKAGCLDAANWSETDLARHVAYDTEIFNEPALALDPTGRPRVVARIFAFDEQGGNAGDGVYYLECDAGCRDPEGWRRAEVLDAGGGSYPSPGWDIAVDPQGRRRIALFAGDGMEQADLSHTLIYLWCDGGDCVAEDAWDGTVVSGDAHGEMPDLELTPEGRPRLAFRLSGGALAYAWCDEDCETLEETGWRAAVVEGQEDLQAERPTALPVTCDAEVWEALAPQLALGPDGALVVAYDQSVEGRCLTHEDGTPEDQIDYSFHEIWRGARVVTFAP